MLTLGIYLHVLYLHNSLIWVGAFAIYISQIKHRDTNVSGYWNLVNWYQRTHSWFCFTNQLMINYGEQIWTFLWKTKVRVKHYRKSSSRLVSSIPLGICLENWPREKTTQAMMIRNNILWNLQTYQSTKSIWCLQNSYEWFICLFVRKSFFFFFSHML